MVNEHWLKEHMKQVEEQKQNDLKSKGLLPFWNPVQGENVIQVLLDTPPKQVTNTWGGVNWQYRLVEPAGTVWSVSHRVDQKIMKALAPFFSLPPSDVPPFAVLKVFYDKAALPKDRYKVVLG